MVGSVCCVQVTRSNWFSSADQDIWSGHLNVCEWEKVFILSTLRHKQTGRTLNVWCDDKWDMAKSNRTRKEFRWRIVPSNRNCSFQDLGRFSSVPFFSFPEKRIYSVCLSVWVCSLSLSNAHTHPVGLFKPPISEIYGRSLSKSKNNLVPLLQLCWNRLPVLEWETAAAAADVKRHWECELMTNFVGRPKLRQRSATGLGSLRIRRF